jgi:poly(A) polymerase
MVNPIPTLTIPDLIPIQKLYQTAGFDLRYVGGCVRDTLLGLQPNDYDLATPMPAKQGLALLSEQGYAAIPTGLDHGTFTLVINKQPFEITTLRKDVTTDGRRATIAYTTNWEEDAARRDFTINALYMDFEGTLYDYTQGQQDLRQGIVQFIGQAVDRIQEDYLRILRYFRFHERFSTQDVPADLKETFKLFAPRLKTLSAERVTQEFFLLLESHSPYKELALMDECDILRQFLGPYDLSHFYQAFEAEQKIHVEGNALRRFASLKCPHHSLRLSNKQRQYLHKLTIIETHLDHESTHYLVYKYGLQEVLDALLLRNDIDRWAQVTSLAVLPIPIDGHDLAEIGIPKGPKLGKAFRLAERIWCDHHYTLPKQDLLNLVQAEFLRAALKN